MVAHSTPVDGSMAYLEWPKPLSSGDLSIVAKWVMATTLDFRSLYFSMFHHVAGSKKEERKELGFIAH
jgi:hypothetical protein